MAIDGLHFRINEPSPFSKKWYSHKLQGPGLTYEIAVAIRSGDIVWAYGGYPAGEYPDDVMACEAFVNVIDRELGEHVIADDKYNHLPFFLCPVKDSFTERDLIMRRILARHENVNSRVRRFRILRDYYIGNLKFHPTIFKAIVNLCQVEIDNMHKLPDVQGLDE